MTYEANQGKLFRKFQSTIETANSGWLVIIPKSVQKLNLFYHDKCLTFIRYNADFFYLVYLWKKQFNVNPIVQLIKSFDSMTKTNFGSNTLNKNKITLILFKVIGETVISI